MSPIQEQIDQKIELIDIASRLTSISLPVGSSEDKIVTQLERWYQFLNLQAVPDETVFTSPVLPPPPVHTTPPATPQNPVNQIAAAIAPALAEIPGTGGQVASTVANVIANLPFPTLTSAPIATK